MRKTLEIVQSLEFGGKRYKWKWDFILCNEWLQKKYLKIDSCEMVSPHIKELMPKLISQLESDLELSYKLLLLNF